jgi:hypothetical protein
MGFKTLESSEEAIERHARKCVALAQVARAWESAVDRARILRGRPLPGSLRPKASQKQGRSPSAKLLGSSGPIFDAESPQVGTNEVMAGDPSA